MISLIGKRILKLLLVIAMVIQPVAFSYAMASMTHGSEAGSNMGMTHAHHQASASTGESHNNHHDMMHGDTALDTHQPEESSDTMNNCCNTAACCPAAVVSIEIELFIPSTLFPPSTAPSWKGIDLSADAKPPRRHFS